MGEKLCKTCNTNKEINLFVKSTYCKSGYRSICKACFNAYYAKRRIEKYEKVREYEKKFHFKRRLKYDYNLTEEQYLLLKENQNYSCAICKDSKKKLVIDHCHTTGKVRGLLCTNCNTALGHFKDNIKFLDSAKDYLNKNVHIT